MDPLTMGLIGGGLSLLGGLFGGDGEDKTWSRTQTQLGKLPDWLQLLNNQAYGAAGDVTGALRRELAGLPDALQFGALASDPFRFLGMNSRDVGRFLSQPGQVTEAQRAAIQNAATSGLDIAGLGYQQQSEAARRNAELATTGAIQDLTGAFAASGIRGGTPLAGGIGREIAGLTQGLQNFEAQRSAEMAGLARGAQGFASQAMLDVPFRERQLFAQGIAPLAFQNRSQMMGLRGMADSNRQLLLANPLIHNLFQRELGTATSVTEGTGKAASNGLGGAFGGLGGLFLGQSLMGSAAPGGGGGGGGYLPYYGW